MVYINLPMHIFKKLCQIYEMLFLGLVSYHDLLTAEINHYTQIYIASTYLVVNFGLKV